MAKEKRGGWLRCGERGFQGAEKRIFLDTLERGRLVACTTRLGYVLWASSESPAAVASLYALRQRLSVSRRLSLCVSTLEEAKRWWPERLQGAQLEDLLQSLFLNLVVFVAPPRRPLSPHLWPPASKLSVWIGQRGLAHLALQAAGHPLLGLFLPPQVEWEGEKVPVSELLTKRLHSEIGLVLSEVELEGAQAEPLVIDIGSHVWRILILGAYSMRELRSFIKRPLILSSDATKSLRERNLFEANIILYLGQVERIARRWRAICEHGRNLQELVFFLHSPALYRVLAEWNEGREEGSKARLYYPLALPGAEPSPHSLSAEETLRLIERLRFEEDTSRILIEGWHGEEEPQFYKVLDPIIKETVSLDSQNWDFRDPAF